LFPLVATHPEHDREKPKIPTPLVGEILIAGLSMCNFETNNVVRAVQGWVIKMSLGTGNSDTKSSNVHKNQSGAPGPNSNAIAFELNK